MLSSFRKSGTNPLVIGILGILVVGLIGFGGRVSSGIGASGVASVGGETVTTDDYIRAMQRELQNVSQQLGQQVSLDQAMALGIDRIVLSRLVAAAALDSKARELGLSVGDAAVRDSLMQTEAFQGLDDKFDNDAYGFALERMGLTPAEYDILIRKGTTRDLIRRGISAGVAMPESAAAALLAYAGEKRGFDRVTLTATALPVPVATPGEFEARAFYDAHNDRFMTPETREITYVALNAADLAPTVTVTDAKLREAYDSRIAEFEIPETRAVERLAFASEADATSALARINSGEITFEALVAGRDLNLADLDLGIIARPELPVEARETVFGPANPGIYGPAVTLLGPALFRVNAILAPVSTPFEQAVATLRPEIALVEASGLVADEAAKLQDLLAGGATFEDIDAETAFALTKISWHPGLTEGIAADPVFQSEAAAVTEGEDRDPVNLSDGGIAVLRLDAIRAPTLRPFAEVAALATAALKLETESTAIAAYAEQLRGEISTSTTLAALASEKGLALHTSPPTNRGGTIAGAPVGLIEKLFEIKAQETAIVASPDRADLVQLTAITPFDPSAAENQPLMQQASQQLSRQVSDDLFAVYAQAVQDEAGVSINASLIQALLQRFP